MFDDDTSLKLAALFAGRILAHQRALHKIVADNPAKLEAALDQAATASAEVTVIARILGLFEQFNAILTEIGIGPLPDLSPDDSEATRPEYDLNAVVHSHARLTTNPN